MVFLPGIYYATHIKWTGDLGNKNRVEGPASAIGDGSVKGTYVLIVEAPGDSLRLFLKGEGYGPAFPVKTHLGTFASKGLIKSWNSFLGPPVRNSTFKLIDRYSEQEDERVRVVRQSGASQTDFSMSFVLAQERDYQSGKKGRYLIQNNEAQNGFPADLNDTGIFAWMYFARVTPGIVRW